MSIMIRKTEAILSLLPNARFAMVDSTITVWEDDRPQPTDDEIDAELNRLQAEYDSLSYARSRKQEYDKLNQFEMQFDDQRDGTSTWIDSINEIKERCPK